MKDFGTGHEQALYLRHIPMKQYTKPMFSISLARWVGAAAILFIVCTSVQAAGVGDKWEKLHDELDEALTLINKQRQAPASSWVPFKEDKKSLEADLESLLAEVVDILNISDLTEIKADIRAAQRNVRDYRKRISELQTEKLMAPEKVAGWKVWKKDAADYEEQIEDYRSAVDENEDRITALKTRFLEKIESIGITLTEDQIDTLIYSVTGDDDVEMIAVFDNIKILTQKLRELTRESRENIETARRYYGMHVVLLKTLLYLHGVYIQRIDEDHLPALKAIAGENRELMAQTEDLLKDAAPHHRDQYAANLDAQRLTDETAALYIRYLQRNRERVAASMAKIRKEYEVAENTYHTVSTAYALIAVMRSADRFFNALSALQTPDLLTFDNREMREEFRKLTSKMAQE